MLTGTIYALADPDTGDIRYCGKTVRRLNHRMNGHRGDAKNGVKRHSCNWLRSIFSTGREPKVIILETVYLGNYPRMDQMRILNASERRWISKLRAGGCDLTNSTDGGDGCHGVVLSPERREKLRLASVGRIKSAETRARISASKKGRPSHPSGPLNPGYGKPLKFSDNETRKKNLRAAWGDPVKRAEHGRTHLGEANFRASITTKTAAEIFLCPGTLKSVASKFSTTIKVVWDIRNKKSWRHITDSITAVEA